MSHGSKKESDIISLDLIKNISQKVDVTGDFPFSRAEVVTQ
jgi:hypothetical protein